MPLLRRDGRLALGRRGERAAARYLARRGYRILIRNYRCFGGEIDLICSQGDSLVFVEVKTRTSEEAEELHQALRMSQWRQIEKAAGVFLRRYNAQHRPCRFDLVTVLWPARGSPRIEHFQDAFRPQRT